MTFLLSSQRTEECFTELYGRVLEINQTSLQFKLFKAAGVINNGKHGYIYCTCQIVTDGIFKYLFWVHITSLYCFGRPQSPAPFSTAVYTTSIKQETKTPVSLLTQSRHLNAKSRTSCPIQAGRVNRQLFASQINQHVHMFIVFCLFLLATSCPKMYLTLGNLNQVWKHKVFA